MYLCVTGINKNNEIIRQDKYFYKRVEDLKEKLPKSVYKVFSTSNCAVISDEKEIEYLQRFFPKAHAVLVENFN